MPQLSLQCPHCGTEKIGFAPKGAVPVSPNALLTLLFLQCQGCGQAVVATIGGPTINVTSWMQGALDAPGTIKDIYPTLPPPQVPADIPPNVAKAFLSGLDNLRRSENANAAAMMFRRSVELAVKALNPNAPKDDNLKKRIGDLSPDLATPAMKDWAHHVRLDANDAAHEDEEFSEEDARKLHTFAEMFLTYAYTLPKMLERARGKPETPVAT